MSSDYQLPVFEQIPDGIRNGRNVREGYSRGWGLEFGDLKDKVRADPLYQEAMGMAHGRTVQSEANRMNMYLLIKFFVKNLAVGHIAEFGSYRGGSAIFMAKVCSVLQPDMKVYAFDTFDGMPETDSTIDAHNAGDFKDANYDDLRSYVAKSGLKNLTLVRGLFQETAPSTLATIGKIRLLHIDCDIRSAVIYSYEITKPSMVPGGYICLDDALYSSCLGATEAVEDLMIRRDGLNSEQVYPQFTFRAPH